MIDAFTAPNSRHDFVFFRFSLRWDQDSSGLPNQLVGGVAKDAIRGGVAGLNDAVQVLREDRVIRRFDNG